MRVSVVIHAPGPPEDLTRTLRALRHQAHAALEVVVILTGPGADAGDAILAEFAAAVKVGRCPDGHFARARTRALALASGEVVAFLDAGAVPDPRWLAEVVGAYDSDLVAGVGAVARDPWGRPVGPDQPVSDRCGGPREPVRPPWWGYLLPEGEQFVPFLGSAASFRRRCLEGVG